jgi:hypothetical protein
MRYARYARPNSSYLHLHHLDAININMHINH